MGNAWQFLMGYRYAVFNQATQALGGAVNMQCFDLTTPRPDHTPTSSAPRRAANRPDEAPRRSHHRGTGCPSKNRGPCDGVGASAVRWPRAVMRGAGRPPS
ncbi:hypothetical protein GCM10022214_51050 [Actinomadura miaoliensis]|uniref:Uncharacterized protein n=1 Tax=Actinomadura miaoliensis TaxID=430685 RepID=A0ABP7WAN9_9ACTN